MSQYPDNYAVNVQTIAECGCPKQILSQREFKATFVGLNSEEYYFPMIARTTPDAFFGLPPDSVRPQGMVTNSPPLEGLSRGPGYGVSPAAGVNNVGDHKFKSEGVQAQVGPYIFHLCPEKQWID